MNTTDQARLAALRQLAEETQARVTAAGKRSHKRGKTPFRVSKLVSVERVELAWACSRVELSEEAEPADLDRLEALASGAGAAKGEEVAIHLADLHWLLEQFPPTESPDQPHLSDQADDQADTVLDVPGE